MREKPFRTLFLCTGNSARSIMAEAILRHSAGDRFEAFSAGSHPTGTVHPFALQLLERLQIPVAGLHSKRWDTFAGEQAPELDFVFTVCDAAAGEACPAWPGQPMTAHWGVPDPARAPDDPVARAQAFRDAFATLERRISLFTSLPIASLDSLRLKLELDAIGRAQAEQRETA